MTSRSDARPAVTMIKAPLSGILVALEDVPDPVFAQKVVGDGISIDPVTEQLLAPCDGHVQQLHRSGHAITITTDTGIEVLTHIGLDTVSLKGQGFTPRVAVGDQVRAGDPLIDFDADFVATHAKSLLTQIIVTARDAVVRLDPARGRVRAGEDVILRVRAEPAAGSLDQIDHTGRGVVSKPVRVPNPTGLHARPAAVLATLARPFQADVRLRLRGREANAKSVVAVMSLDVGHGDEVEVVAEGPEADIAVKTVASALASGLGEQGVVTSPPVEPSTSPDVARSVRPAPVNPNVLVGVAASGGVAIGRLVQFHRSEVSVPSRGGSADAERRRLESALAAAKRQLEEMRLRLRGEADYGKAAIFAAQEEMLSDPELVDAATQGIARGQSAAFAWRAAAETHAALLAGLKNELLAARAQDVRDVGRRVLHGIVGHHDAREYPADTILIAEELTPSDVAGFDRTRVLGFGTTTGGASSHVAILARSFELPAVAGVDPSALTVPEGTLVILDGTRGVLTLSPTSEVIAQIRRRTAARTERQRLELAQAHVPAVTLDGRRIEVAANASDVAEAIRAVTVGADGIGLLRTELLFMDRVTPPSEDEQADAYRAIVQALGPERTTIIRTLDVGGDKPLPYLPLPKEDNPFLGLRGLRVGLDRPDVLRTQLRAILRASAAGPVRVMFPMVATLIELRDARAMLDEECRALGTAPIPVGIMVEVPSVALLAPAFAREVDFFSIGSNDLTQYTLAMDRGHPKLAARVDALNPAVLRLIDLTVRAAHERGKWVGVCGGMAGDAQAVPILVGLGVDELSVSVPAIAAVKSQIRTLTFEQCRDLASRAVDADTELDVRAMSPAFLD
ncbi:MAG: phosphoenolpyruvate--protein phosphotransferase [Acidobacteria bacterium 13_1_40CM_65_14]|nr:MAG: phosphoenolpyruvate--protein phosphotransferase [Acidobacteria bacterium 13_1_40CM_65_14]